MKLDKIGDGFHIFVKHTELEIELDVMRQMRRGVMKVDEKIGGYMVYRIGNLVIFPE